MQNLISFDSYHPFSKLTVINCFSIISFFSLYHGDAPSFYSSFSAEDISIDKVCETILICKVAAFHIDHSHLLFKIFSISSKE